MGGKQTKRARNFDKSGGIKGRLEKGTVTKKGKLKRTGRSKNDDGPPKKQVKPNTSYKDEIVQKRREDDFVSQKNLGDMDMKSFFSSFAAGVDADVMDDNDEQVEDDDDESDDDESNQGEEESAEESSGKSENKSKKAKPSSASMDDHSDSDSEDEDVEAAERRMKQEMGKLQASDPEFHKFLKENEETLLEYGDDKEEEDDLEKTEVDEDEPMSGGLIQLTPAVLKKLEQGTFKSHGVKSLKKLVNAYKSACHMADSSPDENVKGNIYQMDSSAVFDRIMVTALKRCHEEFFYHLLGEGSMENAPLQEKKDDGEQETEQAEEPDDNKPLSPKLLEKSRRWSVIKPILFTFLKATMHILTEAKEPDLVTFILKAMSKYVPYMTPFPRVAEAMLKALTALWSAPIDSSEDYEVVRLHSFLRIRQLALTQPFPFIEECLKKLYLAYAQRAKFATASSVTSALPTLTFMGNCVVELYSLDYHSSYQHAFVYIRQLALHLRTAMQKKTAEAFGAVYCWQFLHCLKLWVAVLTEACQSKDADGSNEEQLLRSLLFPLTQVILGTSRLIPSTRYLPLRLHCVRLLQQLAAAAEVFLPTTSILLEVLDLRELYQPPKRVEKSNVQPMALTLKLRADSPLRTNEELEMCVSEVFVLLNREVDLYQYSAGFPEFSVRISQRLRKVRQHHWETNYLLAFLQILTMRFFFHVCSLPRKLDDMLVGGPMPRDAWIYVSATPRMQWTSGPSSPIWPPEM
jgi:nucleolar complex protein 2